MNDILDRLACILGIWALRRLYQPECHSFDVNCPACRAADMIATMEDILQVGK